MTKRLQEFIRPPAMLVLNGRAGIIRIVLLSLDCSFIPMELASLGIIYLPMKGCRAVGSIEIVAPDFYPVVKRCKISIRWVVNKTIIVKPDLNPLGWIDKGF